jgi:hypothetical protein
MWCFFDESWAVTATSRLLVVAGLLVNSEFLPKLDDQLYRTKRKYFGQEHAKNRAYELKGKDLLSNASFRMAERLDSERAFVHNHAVVKELLGYLVKEKEDDSSPHYIRVFASAVLGPNPQLLCPDLRRIPPPYKWLCLNISRAVAEAAPDKNAVLIYDQRFQVQTGLAITLKGFNSGLGIKNLHPTPYFGVSHATPCLQLSDIIVFIISRHLAGDRRFQPFYNLVKRLQWTAEVDGRLLYGINSWLEPSQGAYTKR